MNFNNVKAPKMPGGGAASALVKAGLLGGLGLYAALNSLYNVDGGHRAIVFNRLVGVKDKVYPEGTHLMIPWFERPVIYDVRARPHLVESTSGSRDLQMVKIGLRVLTRPVADQLPTIYRTLGENYNERVLPSIIHETLKAVVAQYNASQLITQREAVSREIRKILTERAANFNIALDDVSITTLTFGREFTAAIEAKLELNLPPFESFCIRNRGNETFWISFYDIMDNLQMNRNPTLYHILILSFLQLSFVFDLSCAFSPVDNYLIDCGSVAATTVDVDNRKFVGDSSKSGSLLLSASRTVSLRNGNPPRDSSPLYHSARVFTEPSSYEFDIRTKGTHLVRLHFLPFSSSSRYNLSDALFHVSSNGFVLLSDFTVLDRGNPVLKEYLTWVDGEKLVITFTPLRGFPLAFVNAIEVISAPEDLIADTASYITSDGRIEKFSGLTKQALETVYRINVGGPKVTPFNDTLWRTWVPDDEFLKSSGSSKVFYFSGRIRYHRGGASREVAPDNVYNSARAVINQKASKPDSNITWDFPVSSDYKYLVRMHFCDIASITLNLLYFNVYINGYLAYKDLDLSYLTSQMLAAPFYADFIVDGHCSGVISLSIGPSDGSMPERINAILNGVEIMKMNNSVGSLAGEVSLNLLLKSSPKRSFGFLVPAVAVLSLFISALALILKRRTEVKGSVAWSPLPIDVSEGNIKSTNKLGFF